MPTIRTLGFVKAMTKSVFCLASALILGTATSFVAPRIGRVRSSRHASPFEAFFAEVQKKLQPKEPKVEPGSEFNEDIAKSKALLLEASVTKSTNSGDVVEALLGLEKSMRAKARVDDAVAPETLQNLNGAWRLVFTTGTIDTQKKVRNVFRSA